jgi:hypothetical protein
MMDKSLVITGRHGNYDISIWKSAFVTTFGMFSMNFGANFSETWGNPSLIRHQPQGW